MEVPELLKCCSQFANRDTFSGHIFVYLRLELASYSVRTLFTERCSVGTLLQSPIHSFSRTHTPSHAHPPSLVVVVVVVGVVVVTLSEYRGACAVSHPQEEVEEEEVRPVAGGGSPGEGGKRTHWRTPAKPSLPALEGEGRGVGEGGGGGGRCVQFQWTSSGLSVIYQDR